MNYKIILLSLGALVFDLVLGAFVPEVAPVALIALTFYLSVKFEYWQALPIALGLGFLFDISLLDGSIFNAIFLVCISAIAKATSHRVVDFSNPSIQVISVIFVLAVRMLIFYLIYDRTLNSIFITHNLIALLATALCMIITLSLVRFYAEKK